MTKKVKKIKKLKKFRLGAKLCDLIKHAAKVATGTHTLYDSDSDAYCIWGEVARHVGVPNRTLIRADCTFQSTAYSRASEHTMNNLSEAESQVLDCEGYDEWDCGLKAKAIKKACKAAAGMTVGQFIKLMKKTKLIRP